MKFSTMAKHLTRTFFTLNRGHITPSRTATALVVALGAATPTLAAVCNNVTFSLTNQSDGPILVTEVRYRDLDSGNPGQFRVENVRDFSCPSEWTCATDEQDLGSVTRPRENHELTDIQFHHSHQDAFGIWQPAVWSSSNVPADMTCTDGRNYGHYDVN
jgi:hypothetical protein